MKLGLLALSGVRCHNQELMALGLTLPGFVERSQVIASLPSLGLLTLAGFVPDDIELTYREVPDPAALETLPGPFDAVALSSFSAQMPEAYALADRYRAAGVIVLLGGLHVTACPDEAATHADAIVIGEAEPVWPQVLDDLRAGKLKPRYDARPLPAYDLGQTPPPRFDLLDIGKYNRLTVQTQRGCPFSCEFCAASIRLRPGYRTKPVDKVVAEIRRIKEIWPHPFIEFADDNTFASKEHGRALARALADEGVRWFTETDLSLADDPVLLDLLRASGCAQVLIGLESPVAAALDGLEQKSNWKRRQFDRYRAAIDRIQEAGVTVNGCFVLGLDGSETADFEEIFRFVKESGLYEVQITVMTPFPGTPLYERLEKEGRLLRPGAWEMCTLFDINYEPARMSVEELDHGLRGLARRLYDTDFIAERQRRFLERQSRLRRAQSGES